MYNLQEINDFLNYGRRSEGQGGVLKRPVCIGNTWNYQIQSETIKAKKDYYLVWFQEGTYYFIFL